MYAQALFVAGMAISQAALAPERLPSRSRPVQAMSDAENGSSSAPRSVSGALADSMTSMAAAAIVASDANAHFTTRLVKGLEAGVQAFSAALLRDEQEHPMTDLASRPQRAAKKARVLERRLLATPNLKSAMKEKELLLSGPHSPLHSSPRKSTSTSMVHEEGSIRDALSLDVNAIWGI